MIGRVRGGDPATLAAGLPFMAADVDAGLLVEQSSSLGDWIRRRDASLIWTIGAGVGVASLALLLSAMSIFSLVSVSVSRRTREIGLRVALGAHPRQVLGGVVSRGVVLMGSGLSAGAVLLLWAVALGQGPTGQPAEDVARFALWLGMTSAVMLAACLLACIVPARRALSINPSDALKET